MWDVLLLLSTILNDLWVKLYEYLMRGYEKSMSKSMATSEYKNCNLEPAIQKSLKVRYLFLIG